MLLQRPDINGDIFVHYSAELWPFDRKIRHIHLCPRTHDCSKVW